MEARFIGLLLIYYFILLNESSVSYQKKMDYS